MALSRMAVLRVCSAWLLYCVVSTGALATTKTYVVPGNLTVTGYTDSGYTYGVSGEVVDHAFDGQTITINSIAVQADGNAVGHRLNFDWQVWVNDAAMGIVPVDAAIVSDYFVAAQNTRPLAWTVAWAGVLGDGPVSTTGPFALTAHYDFANASGGGTPLYAYTKIGDSTSTTYHDGLYLQVSAWSGDSGAGPSDEVDFGMSNIQVTIDYTVQRPTAPAYVAVPALSAGAKALLALLLTVAGLGGVAVLRRRA